MFRWLILANTLSFISFFNSFSHFSDISGIFYFVISPKTQKHSKTMIKSKLFCCLVISEFFFKVTMTKSISIQESYLKFFFGAHFWSSLIFWSFLRDIFTFLDSGKMMIVKLVTWPLFLWTTLCGKSRKYRIFFTLWKLKNKTNLEAQNNWHWFWSKWNLIKSYSLKNLLVFLDFGFIIILAVTFKNFVSFKLEQSREILENLHLEKIDFFSSCIKKLEAKFLLIKYSRPKINWRFPKKAESILSIKYPKDCFNPIK